MSNRIIIGLGTGRCGSTSLAGLLRKQPGTEADHQTHRLRWQGEVAHAILAVTELRSRDCAVAANVCFSWLPYVQVIAERFPEARFLCMQRNREGYIDSWLESQPGRNPWQETLYDTFDLAYPQFGIADTALAAGFYWDLYDAVARHFAAILPTFRIFRMDALNSEAGQEEMLRFAGYVNPVLAPGLTLNRRGTPWRQRFEETPCDH